MENQDGTEIGAGTLEREPWKGIQVPWIVQSKRLRNSLTISLYGALGRQIR